MKLVRRDRTIKTWQLVSGILSIVFFMIVEFQSCAAGFVNSVESNETDLSAGGGLLVGILLLAAGIVSIVTRESGRKGHMATAVLFGLAALIGYASLGTYGDLVIWATWCLVCAVIAIIGIVKSKQPKNAQ